jgi:hypothetical protein
MASVSKFLIPSRDEIDNTLSKQLVRKAGMGEIAFVSALFIYQERMFDIEGTFAVRGMLFLSRDA